MSEATNAAEVRAKLLAAASAAAAAVSAIAELLREDETVDGVLPHAAAFETDPDGELLPIGEDIIEPLADALLLAIHAGGLVRPTHRMAAAIERFQFGDDD